MQKLDRDRLTRLPTRNLIRAHRLRAMPIVCALLCLASAHSASAQTLYLDEQFGFSLTTGVIFASKPAGSPAAPMDLRLELYEPSGAGIPSNRPVVVAIHGGGFTGGSRFSSMQIGTCERMAKRGWTCVSIDYRLLGDQPVVGPGYTALESLIAANNSVIAPAIAAACEDTVAALEWLIVNAVSLDIDSNRIGLAGYSAGGATTEFVTYMLDNTGTSLPVIPLATFNLAGSFDPLITIVDPLITIVDLGDPPAILVHGDMDTVVDPVGAQAFANHLQAAGVTHELNWLTGYGHGIDIFTDEVSPGVTVFEQVVPFFVTHVANGPVAPPVPGLGILGMVVLAIAMIGAVLFARPDFGAS